MNTYYALVKYKDEPGAGYSRVPIQAQNPYQALQLAKSLYGRLLMSESITYS
jgi:hypothetical protein